METAEVFFRSLSDTASVTALVGRCEDLYFEAKTCSVPLADSDQRVLAKALSSFANSDGGVLVYGLVAKGGNRTRPDSVQGAKPVKRLAQLESETLSLMGQLTQPAIDKVVTARRGLARTSDQGFLLIYVPPSDKAPHRSVKDREYYRRTGDTSLPMEHYEIAEMFGRRKVPRLEFRWDLSFGGYTGAKPARVFQAQIIVGLYNPSSATAKYPALVLNGAGPCHHGLDGNGHTGLPRRASLHDTAVFGGGADDVIYPGVFHAVTKLQTINISERSPSVSDVTISYEIYAEDMPSLRNSLTVPGAEIIERFRQQPLDW